jgi:hypothetical protein
LYKIKGEINDMWAFERGNEDDAAEEQSSEPFVYDGPNITFGEPKAGKSYQ